MFGYWYELTKQEIRALIAHVEEILERMDQPFIYNGNAPLNIDLTEEHGSDHLYGWSAYLFGLGDEIENKTGETKEHQILLIADQDDEWTERRNEEYRYTVFRKLTLKPEVQDKARERLTDLSGRLREAYNTLSEDDLHETRRKEARRQKYRIENEMKKTFPLDEDGNTDTYFEADVVNNETGERTRMYIRSIFDVGVVIRPCRLRGVDAFDDSIEWTFEEESARAWLHEFGPFNRLEM